MDNKTDNYITVLTFTYSHEPLIIRGRLESEGIECNLKDEFTAQINPLYSNAIGGIKLQVKESDLSRAIAILEETGYMENNDFQSSKSTRSIDKFVSKLPFFNKLKPETSIIVVVVFVLGLLITLIYFST